MNTSTDVSLKDNGSLAPAGTNVSINAWVLQRHVVFGERTEEFVPERWLQREQEKSFGDL